jgi:hypothetical protein
MTREYTGYDFVQSPKYYLALEMKDIFCMLFIFSIIDHMTSDKVTLSGTWVYKHVIITSSRY